MSGSNVRPLPGGEGIVTAKELVSAAFGI
jgi:hypothetical protein